MATGQSIEILNPPNSADLQPGVSRRLEASSSARAAFLALAPCAVLAAIPSQAATGDPTSAPPEPVEQMVVTATRSELNLEDAPFAMSLLNDDDLREKRQVRTLPESLREMPGVSVQKTAHGQGSPYIRGFTGYRNLLLIDGVRLNNSVFRDGPNQYWNTVDPLSAGRLEVVRGPSSTLYGSDAIGGTVQVFSRGMADLNVHNGYGGTALFRHSDAEHSNVYRVEAGIGSVDGLSVFAGGSYKDFGDIDVAGLGSQNKTGYDEHSMDGRLEYVLEQGGRIVLAHQRVEQDDAWRTHRTVFGESWQNTQVGNELRRSLDQDRQLTYLQWRDGELFGWLTDVRASLSYQRQQEERKRTRGDGRRDVQGFSVDTTGAWFQASTANQLGSWTGGVEWYHDDVDSYGRDYAPDGALTRTRAQGPVADDADYDVYAVFLQDQIELGDRALLILGGRYTFAQTSAGTVVDPATGELFSIKQDWGKFTTSARTTVRLDQQGSTRLFAGVSQSFRAPNLSDMTRFDSNRSNEIETPVSQLDPEQYLSYEVGARVNRGSWWGEASYYYTDIDDMIIRTPTGVVIDGDNEVTKRNSGDGKVRGIELQLGIQLTSALSWFGTATWMDGDVATYPTSEPIRVRETIDREMPLVWHTGLRWTAAGSRLWVEGLITHADKQTNLSTRDRNDLQRIPPGGTPDYSTVALRSTFQISGNVVVSAALENITDEDFRIHGSGINEPGRNFVVSLNWHPGG